MNRNQIVIAHAGFGRLEMIVSAAAAAVSKVYRAWAIARARRDLHRLSDHTLKDIGLRRDQINSLFS